MIKKALARLYMFPAFRRACVRFGPAVWRLPFPLRRRLCSEEKIPRLRGARLWRYSRPERVDHASRIPPPMPYPTLGHQITARPLQLAQPFVATLERAWLIGKHATPVTPEGNVLLTAFRDQPGMMALEPHPDLERWVSLRGWEAAWPDLPLCSFCSLVNRLDPNYFHWIVEWCGQVEGLLYYEQQTGIAPTILIRAGGARFLRASLELLGIHSERIREWSSEQEPCAVENLIVPSIPGGRVTSSPQSLAWLRQRFLAGAGVTPHTKQAQRKIYIPRRPGGWRCVVNDAEVCRALTEQGFDILSPEGLSLPDQICYFSEARLIVGMHGAGLTNVLFAPQASMLELLGCYGGGEYYNLCAAFGQAYTGLVCRAVGQDIEVDVKDMLCAIERLSAL